MKKDKNSVLEGKSQIKGGVKSEPHLLNAIKYIFSNVMRIYSLIVLVGLIMFNFYVFGMEMFIYISGKGDQFGYYAFATGLTICALILYLDSIIRNKGED